MYAIQRANQDTIRDRTYDGEVAHMISSIDLNVIDVTRITAKNTSNQPRLLLPSSSISNLQPDDSPLVVPFCPAPLALPSVSHVETSTGQQEVGRDPEMLVRLSDDSTAVESVGEIDPFRGRRGLRPAVSSESALRTVFGVSAKLGGGMERIVPGMTYESTIGDHGQLDVRVDLLGRLNLEEMPRVGSEGDFRQEQLPLPFPPISPFLLLAPVAISTHSL